MSVVEEKDLKMHVVEPYVEADSTNLPKVDTKMLFDFLKDGRYFSYTDCEKDKENLYGDDSIGYVTLLRNSAYCVVKAVITTNNDSSDSCFPIRAKIFETNNVILKIQCQRCIPVECVHGFALIMWLHRRTEETVDEVVNYYKKPGSIFSRIPKKDMADHLVTLTTSSPYVRKVPYMQKSANVGSPMSAEKQSLLSKIVSQLVNQPKIVCMYGTFVNFLMRPKPKVDDSKPQIKNLFMGQLVKNFLKLNIGTVEDFMTFAEKQMTDFLCQEAEKLTRVQRTDLWKDLRYGRITASIIHEASCCRVYKGSLADRLWGKASRYPAMKRGSNLENKILQEVQIQENITTGTSGLFLIPSCPIVGASPDAIGSDFIVVIKAPRFDSSFETFLPSGRISTKCKRQMYLQMYCTGMKKGIFCVADPNFERNKKVTTVWLDYDNEFDKVLTRAKLFWMSCIFPRLVNL